MFRQAETYLNFWLTKKNRCPLLIRGARQIGKSYLVTQFGKANFKNLVTINFESMPTCIQDFKILNPHEIINRLQIQTLQKIIPGETLLFLDEIQECPEAILALRYFKEQLPDLAVIAAGSLLEFTLHDSEFRMPVGRVEFLFLQPMSFEEFLLARGEGFLLDWIKAIRISDSTPESIHQKALLAVRDYTMTGGMPEAVQHFIDHPMDILGVAAILSKLTQGYALDFGKYAHSQHQHGLLKSIFPKLPHHIGQQISYNKLDDTTGTREIKATLEALQLAGLCHPILWSNGEGVPLNANQNPKKFKLLYLDTGLYLRELRLNAELFSEGNLSLVNSGALAEQWVGQQLLTLQPFFEKPTLYFWTNDTRGSQSEIDYLWQKNDKILPIEVKAGNSRQMKSLEIYKSKFSPPYGIRISHAPLGFENPTLLSIPYYLIGQLDRLCNL
jgi:predicted AAA+ superfamily ATPase